MKEERRNRELRVSETGKMAELSQLCLHTLVCIFILVYTRAHTSIIYIEINKTSWDEVIEDRDGP